MPLPVPSTVRQLSLTREFDDLEDAPIQRVIDEAAQHVSETAAGERYANLVALLTAHLLVDRLGGATGRVRPQVSSERLGPMQRSYQTAQSDGSVLRLEGSSYGRAFKALLDQIPTGPVTLFDPDTVFSHAVALPGEWDVY